MGKYKSLQICCSLRCNLNCSYCFQRCENSNFLNSSSKCSYKQLYTLDSILSEMIEFDSIKLVLTGGEPFVELNFLYELLKLIETHVKRNIRIFVQFNTNGRLLKNNDVEELLIKFANVCPLWLMVSFDHEDKSVAYIDEDTSSRLRQYGRIFLYVVNGKDYIKYVEEDIKKLNDIGFTVKVSYNYTLLDELRDITIAEELYSALKKCNILKELNTSELSLESCAHGYIDENGELKPCYSILYKDVDWSSKSEIENDCSNCDFNEHCHQCFFRKSIYGKGWCELVKIKYFLATNPSCSYGENLEKLKRRYHVVNTRI